MQTQGGVGSLGKSQNLNPHPDVPTLKLNPSPETENAKKQCNSNPSSPPECFMLGMISRPEFLSRSVSKYILQKVTSPQPSSQHPPNQFLLKRQAARGLLDGVPALLGPPSLSAPKHWTGTVDDLNPVLPYEP